MAEYIEREAAIEAVCEDCNKIFPEEPCEPSDCTIMQMLRSIPAANVRPVVKAHWYWDKDGMDWNIGAWRCSACKAMSPMWWNTDRGSPMHKSGHRYCPNCGADMRPEPPKEET